MAVSSRESVQSYQGPLMRAGLSKKDGRCEAEVSRLTALVFDKVERAMITQRRLNRGELLFLLEIEKE